MYRNSLRAGLSFCFGLFAIAIVGCGPRPGTLTGKVTLDGTPIKGGTVTLHNKSGGQSATGEIDENGVYTVNTFSGDYAITVNTEYLNTSAAGGGGRPGGGPGGGRTGSGTPPPGMMMKPGNNIPKDTNPTKGKMEMPGNPAEHGYKAAMPGDAAKRYVKIPGKYGEVESSGLSYSHAGGSQTFDIILIGK